jgi:membrane protein YqaA with SNARE-associated domain
VKIPVSLLIHKANVALQALGTWGLGAMAIVDSAAIPMPLDALLIKDVAENHARFVLYCFVAALGSAIGSLLPYYLGRAGGELFLLKRINRQRYEQLRDRFEKQEFLAIMVPAMMPPPMPVKLFEFAAGVFEMKPQWFFFAIFAGKFVRFLIWAVITILYGPAILHGIIHTLHQHLGYVMGGAGILVVLIGVYVTRKLFDRRRGTKFPVEDDEPAV